VECITLPILVTLEICQVRGTWKKAITATEEGEVMQAGVVEVEEIDETSASLLAQEVVGVVVATRTITLNSKTTRISRVK
jgi:uncharacterized protein (UPF0548 family)